MTNILSTKLILVALISAMIGLRLLAPSYAHALTYRITEDCKIIYDRGDQSSNDDDNDPKTPEEIAEDEAENALEDQIENEAEDKAEDCMESQPSPTPTPTPTPGQVLGENTEKPSTPTQLPATGAEAGSLSLVVALFLGAVLTRRRIG